MPEASLRSGPDSARPIFFAGNTLDELIPQQGDESQIAMLVSIVGSVSGKYNLSGTRLWADSCHGEKHTIDQLHHFHDYRIAACVFWRRSFGLGVEWCDKFKRS